MWQAVIPANVRLERAGTCVDKGVDVVGRNVVAEFVCYDEVPFGWGGGDEKTLR